MIRYAMLFCALLHGALAAPYVIPDAEIGRPYSFQIPVANPNKVELSFRQIGGHLAPGMELDKTGLLHGNPANPGAFTFIVAVFWNDVELCRHDYGVRVLPPAVQLIDPQATGVVLLPPEKPAQNGQPPAAPPPVAPKRDLTLDPLTTAADTVEGMAASKDVTVEIRRNGVPGLTKVTPSESGHFSWSVPQDAPLAPGESIVACISDQVCSVPVVVQPIKRAGEQTRIVLGFQQAGASGADSDQKFFLDFYISRPVPLSKWQEDPRLRWWGNVRVSSVPRQISSPVSASALATSFKSLKVNELAQAAEFLTGLDYQIAQFDNPLWGQSSNSRQRFALSIIAGGGATGPLKPSSAATVAYKVDPASPDYQRLVQAYPQVKGLAYISFVPPSRNQYFAEYFGGLRLVTRYADIHGTPTTGPPAMISFTVGQNELVTGGKLWGTVGRVEAFYPLSTTQQNPLSSIYLFGMAQLRLRSPQNVQPFNLEDASTATPAPGPSNTLFVVTPSNRDVYSIGLGLDLIKIVNSLKISFKTGQQ